MKQQAQEIYHPNCIEQSNSFRLQVCLKQSFLFITLYDLVNKIIYSKDYTEDDIGKQIHRKVDLDDLYSSVYQASQSDQKRTQKNSHNSRPNFIDCEFGEIVTFGNIPCYKVQPGGKVTIYVIMIEKKTNKQTQCESVLNLKQNKQLTNQQFDRLNKLKKKFDREKVLMNTLQKLKIQKGKIKQQLKQYKQQFTQNLIKIKSEITKVVIQQKTQSQQNKVKLNLKINELTQQNKLNKEELKQIKHKNQLMSKKDNRLIQPSILLGLTQQFYSQFRLSGISCIVEFLGDGKSNNNQYPTQFLFNKIIPIDEQFEFRIKIIRSPYCNIQIGIADYSNNIYSRSSSSYWMAKKYEPKPYYQRKQTDMQQGFKQGQIVVVKVLLSEKQSRATWTVNNKQVATKKSKISIQNSYVPCVQFSTVNDIIQFIQ